MIQEEVCDVGGGRGPRVPRSRGPKNQDISKSHSNTSLTLKKVHLVSIYKSVCRCTMINDKVHHNNFKAA